MPTEDGSEWLVRGVFNKFVNLSNDIYCGGAFIYPDYCHRDVRVRDKVTHPPVETCGLMLTLRPVIKLASAVGVLQCSFAAYLNLLVGDPVVAMWFCESILVLAHHLPHSAPPHSETCTLCRADVCTSSVLDEIHCLGRIWCDGGSLMTLSWYCSCKALPRSDWGLVYTHLGQFFCWIVNINKN